MVCGLIAGALSGGGRTLDTERTRREGGRERALKVEDAPSQDSVGRRPKFISQRAALCDIVAAFGSDRLTAKDVALALVGGGLLGIWLKSPDIQVD